MNHVTERNIIKLLLSCSILLYPSAPVNGQEFDAHKIGYYALDQGAYSAAAVFLYAAYLKNSASFQDCEVMAYLLASIEEYAKADSLLKRIQQTETIEELSDSLKFYYYTSRAKVDYYYYNNYLLTLKALSSLKSDSSLLEMKADCYRCLGLYEKAIQEYGKLLSYDNSAYNNCLVAGCYRDIGDYEQAVYYFSEAVKKDETWAFPYYGIGWSYELSGDDDNALNYYNKGIEVDQSFAYLFLKRGEMYLKKGEKELADKDFNAVLRLDKQLEDGTCRQYALLLLGRNDDALNWMNRLIEYQTNNPGHYYDKACLCCRMGLIREAVEAIGLAFEKGYRRFSHLDADDDIDPIKSDSEYLALYKKYHAKYMEELEQLKDI